jgi:hypothetical protein
MHFVWQRGIDLRRSTVEMDDLRLGDHVDAELDPEIGYQRWRALWLEGWRPDEPIDPSSWRSRKRVISRGSPDIVSTIPYDVAEASKTCHVDN